MNELSHGDMMYIDRPSPIPNGLLFDGVQVGNLFVYDSEGNPVDGAQIYTGRGTPLNLYGGNENTNELPDGTKWGWDGMWDGVWDVQTTVTTPFLDGQGKPIWNMYPLDTVPWDPSTGDDPDVSQRAPAVAPFEHAPDRLSEQNRETPAPDASPSPAPDVSVTPGGKATPSPTPSPTKSS